MEMQWAIEFPVAALLLTIQIRTAKKYGNIISWRGVNIPMSLYFLMFLLTIGEALIYLLVSGFSLWGVVTLVLMPVIPMVIYQAFGPNKPRALDWKSQGSRLTVWATGLTIAGLVLLGVCLLVDIPSDDAKLWLSGWDPEHPYANFLLLVFWGGLAMTGMAQMNAVSLAAWWKEERKRSTYEFREMFEILLEKQVEKDLLQGLDGILSMRKRLPDSLTFLDEKNVELYFTLARKLKFAEEKILKATPHFAKDTPGLICPNCILRPEAVMAGPYEIARCPQCQTISGLRKDIRKVVAIVGKVEGKASAGELWVEAWEKSRKEIRYFDFDILLVGEGDGENDFAINALISAWMDRKSAKASRPTLRLTGKPRLSENSIRMLRDFVANPEILRNL